MQARPDRNESDPKPCYPEGEGEVARRERAHKQMPRALHASCEVQTESVFFTHVYPGRFIQQVLSNCVLNERINKHETLRRVAVPVAQPPSSRRSWPWQGSHSRLLSPQTEATTKGQLGPGPKLRLPQLSTPRGTYRWCRETPTPRRPRSGPGGRWRRRQRRVSRAGTWRRRL